MKIVLSYPMYHCISSFHILVLDFDHVFERKDCVVNRYLYLNDGKHIVLNTAKVYKLEFQERQYANNSQSAIVQ